MFLFDLNSTNIATPLPVNRPEITAENGNMSFKYNSVITIEEPQFGIRPIRLAMNGVKILFLLNKLLNICSPPLCITIFKTKLTNRMKNNVFIV